MSPIHVSYVVAAEQDGEFKKLHPVVIKAYDVSHSGPSTVEEGASFDVTGEVTELSDEKDINYVEVILANDVQGVTEKATKTNGKYEATISTDSLRTGDNSLYATVRGNKEVRDRDELLGFSDSTTVTIEEQTPTPIPDDGSRHSRHLGVFRLRPGHLPDGVGTAKLDARTGRRRPAPNPGTHDIHRSHRARGGTIRSHAV